MSEFGTARRRRIAKFVLVGLSGVAVNQGVLTLLHGYLHLHLMISSIIAIELSIISNFVLNSLWTWHYDFQGSTISWLRKLVQYHVATTSTAFVGNVAVLMALVEFLEMDYRIANLIGIAVGSGLNFLFGEFWVFRNKNGTHVPD